MCTNNTCARKKEEKIKETRIEAKNIGRHQRD
jgi:hypothetical protein